LGYQPLRLLPVERAKAEALDYLEATAKQQQVPFGDDNKKSDGKGKRQQQIPFGNTVRKTKAVHASMAPE
jgi:hypothetical protein